MRIKREQQKDYKHFFPSPLVQQREKRASIVKTSVPPSSSKPFLVRSRSFCLSFPVVFSQGGKQEKVRSAQFALSIHTLLLWRDARFSLSLFGLAFLICLHVFQLKFISDLWFNRYTAAPHSKLFLKEKTFYFVVNPPKVSSAVSNIHIFFILYKVWLIHIGKLKYDML